QTNAPPPSTNQAQQAPASGSETTTAQPTAQPSSPAANTAQASSAKLNASLNINDQQRTRVTQAISRLNVQPVTNVNFSLSVGTAVPRDVRIHTLPARNSVVATAD